MAAEKSRGGATREGGIVDSLRAVLTSFLALLRTRLDLISTEIEEEGQRFKEMILLAAISLFCGCLGVIFLTVFVVFTFWDTHRSYVLGGFAAFYLGLGLIVGWILKRKAAARPRLFSATLSELAKDRERLES